MSKKKNTIWILLVVGGLVLLLFLTNFYVKHKVRQELDQRLQQNGYTDLSVNIFSNNFSIKNMEARQDRFSLKAEKVRASGLSYYKFLFNDKLEINDFELISPQIKIFPKDSASSKDSAAADSSAKMKIQIRKFLVKNGSLSKQSDDTATTSLFARIPEAFVNNVKTGMKLSELNSYRLQLDSVYLRMNPQHYIDVGKVSAEDGNVEMKDFKIRSFFPRNEFLRKIPYEKDYITLDVEKISLDSLNLAMRNDSLYVQNRNMTINKANLNIYRNKLVKDDTTTKPLYSKMLREAPVYINFENVVVENSEIVYEEQVKVEDGPAKVRFAAVNGEINNLHNLREISSQPKITANADFMEGTPVNIDWTFPVFNALDKFQISGEFGRLEGEALDPFLIPSMNARARGTVNDIYFNFYGNDDVMQGDFRMNYDNFEIELLTAEKEEKKGFLSAIANLFVDNEQEPEEGGGENVKVERTKNRSFWNYAWKGLREGLIDVVGQL